MVFLHNMLKNKYHVIGVMSGTSLDGLDLVYVTFEYTERWYFKIEYAETLSYSQHWESRLRRLTEMHETELHKIDVEYTAYLATQISAFISVNGIKTIDFVASHGHTALHQPDEGLTYQIGNRNALAELLNLKVICDFRVQDVQLGGQGAPLVPIGDRLLFSDYDYCLNLGGFANISFEQNDKRMAFDICPVNIVLNHFAAKLNLKYDDKGLLASQGKINDTLLEELNALTFYSDKPPKSLGIEWVQQYIFPLMDTFELSVTDSLKTFTEHIAFQISECITPHKKVLITGGGAYNDFLIARLSALSQAEIIIPTPTLIEYKEALIFGLLGVLKARNEVNCLKSVTGASRDHCSGVVFLG